MAGTRPRSGWGGGRSILTGRRGSQWREAGRGGAQGPTVLVFRRVPPTPPWVLSLRIMALTMANVAPGGGQAWAFSAISASCGVMRSQSLLVRDDATPPERAEPPRPKAAGVSTRFGGVRRSALRPSSGGNRLFFGLLLVSFSSYLTGATGIPRQERNDWQIRFWARNGRRNCRDPLVGGLR